MESVTLLPTCVIDTVAPRAGEAVVRVLRRVGFEVRVPRDATCCGQPAWNAGFAEEASRVARTTLDGLCSTEGLICVPAGSCATMIRVFWPELFEVVGDQEARRKAEELRERVREFSELVEERSDRLPLGAGGRRVAYHHSCHMLRELGIKEEPVALLRRLGASAVEWDSDERCCGFGGLFSVKQPETSVAMADDKLDEVEASGAEVLAGCDQSCLMHLEGRLRRRGSAVEVKHLAELVDEATGTD